MSVVNHNVKVKSSHLRSLDIAAKPTRPLNWDSRLLRRQRVDDLHPWLLVEPRIHQSTDRLPLSLPRPRPIVPHHRDHLPAELQQGAAHSPMTVVETHVGRLDESPQHLHLLREIGVVEENSVDRMLAQKHRVISQPLQSPRNVLRATHVPMLSDESQVPVEIGVVPKSRLRAVFVCLMHHEN